MEEKLLRIAVFEPNFLTSKPLAHSSVVLLQNQVRSLAELNNEIMIFVEKWGKTKQIEKAAEDYAIYTLRGKFAQLRLPFVLRDQTNLMSPSVFSVDLISAVAAILRKRRIDIIYTCGTPFKSIFTALLGRLANIPTVHYISNVVSKEWWKGGRMEGYSIPKKYLIANFVKNALQELPRRKLLIKWGLKNTTLLIASSFYIKNQLIEFGIKSDKIHVVYPAVPIRSKRAFRNSFNHKRVTYFGNLWWGRGALDLIQAFVQVHSKHPDATLMIAASNSHVLTERYFSEVIHKHRLKPYVIRKGIVDNVYLDIIDPSTIIVLPYRESPSIKLIEAMAWGKPIVTTNLEWVPELITDGVNGFLCKTGDISCIASKVETILENPRLAEEVGNCARETALAKCDNQKNNHLILSILKRARDIYEF